MARRVTQRQLRNDSGEIMRALDEGDEFIVTRNGVPVAELRPLRRRFVRGDVLLAALGGAPAVDAARFHADVDAALDQDPEPRV